MSEANPCPTCGYQIDRVERMNTENARLRAALTEISESHWLGDGGKTIVMTREADIARRALEQKARKP